MISIIGAGLSGMTAGIVLAQNGHRVVISDGQKAIGGAPSLHPSVHTTPAQMERLWDYVGINLKDDFEKCDPYPVFYYNKRPLKFPPYVRHNTAYCIERGPRKTSIDNHLYKTALGSGVEFEFGKKVDFSRLKAGTIVATGLDPKGYENIGIKYRGIHGLWSFREIDDKSATGAIYMGPYTPDYGYTAQVNGLDYCLLFSHNPISEKDKSAYEDVLISVGMGEYPKPWRKVSMCVPAEARLRSKDLILAGTLSGMIEPFWGYGIVGAIISGMIAAKAVTNPDEAEREHASFTGGFQKKLRRRDEFVAYSKIKREFLIKAGLLWARLVCRFDKELASNPREPLRWFR